MVGTLRMDSFFYHTNLVKDLRISRFYQITRVFVRILQVFEKKTRISDQKTDFFMWYHANMVGFVDQIEVKKQVSQNRRPNRCGKFVAEFSHRARFVHDSCTNLLHIGTFFLQLQKQIKKSVF